MLAIVEAIIVLTLVAGMVFGLRRWIDYEQAQAEKPRPNRRKEQP